MREARIVRSLFSGCFLGASVFAGAAVSDTLTDALISAYQTNPSLEISRATLRTLDENVALARVGQRPTLSARASGSFTSSTLISGVTDTYQASLDAALNLYDGGQTREAIAAAIAGVEAGRANLRFEEQKVLLAATEAFMDVRRDEQFVSLAQSNILVITQQVRAAKDRFEVGEVTRTDVSQAEARLAAARSNLSAALGAQARSRQNYLATVGKEARALSNPPAIPKLANSVDEAQAIAMREHPALAAARARQVVAEHDVERARGAMRPSVSLTGSVGHTETGRSSDSASVALTATVPISTGGRLPSLIRQAQQVLSQRKFEVQDAARLIAQATAIAWADLAVSRASIRARKQQIEAARIAFEGVSEEARLGARTTLDVLDAEQELLNARTDLASAQRDEYVAAFNLLSAMGLLSVQHLGLGVPIYDPTVNYNRVESGPSGTFDGSVVDRISRRWSK